MSAAAFIKTYRRFGLIATLQDLVISIINRFLTLRILVIYLKESPVAGLDSPPDIDIHVMPDDELTNYADRSGYELPSKFLHEANTNGDECFGAFINGELCGYAWYATRPSKSAEESTAAFNPEYAYAYKNLTLPIHRGRNLQKLIKEFTFDYYRRRGKKGIIVAIDSLNFSSRASTAGAGAHAIGYWLYAKRKNWFGGFGSPGTRRFGFRLVSTPASVDTIKAAPPIRIEKITSIEQLLGMHGQAYSTLIAGLLNGLSLPYCPEWMRSVAPLYLASNKRLFFLLAWRGSELIGVAPLMIEQKGLAAGRLRRLYFWGGIQGTLNNMTGDFLIPDTDNITPCLQAFKNYLYGASSKHWDFLELSYFSQASKNLPAFLQVFPHAASKTESMQTFIIDLPASFQEYCDGLPRKPFSDTKRCRRKLYESGASIEICQLQTLSPEVIAELSTRHNQRQDELRTRGAARYSIFHQPRERKAFLELLERAAASGMTRHYLLKINNKLAAFFINFVTQDTLHLFLTAFDTEYSEFAPTKVLLLHVCENELVNLHTRRINLSTGESRYKREFSTQIVDNQHIELITPYLPGKVRYRLWQGLREFKGNINQLRAQLTTKSQVEA